MVLLVCTVIHLGFLGSFGGNRSKELQSSNKVQTIAHGHGTYLYLDAAFERGKLQVSAVRFDALVVGAAVSNHHLYLQTEILPCFSLPR